MEECPIPFPYALRARCNKAYLDIDANIAELLDVSAHYIFGGADAWAEAVRFAQNLRDQFEQSWRDAHAN